MSTVVLGTTEATSPGPFVTTAPSVSPSFAGSARAGIDIVIAFHRNEELVAPLVDSLLACADELRGLGAGMILINDSPDHEPLKPAIESARQRLGRAEIPVWVVTNVANLGFVRSANIGLARAQEAGHDALLLNSDTQVFPWAIAEMVRVASLDPMIGFVSPRSNNATIASLPSQEEYHHQSPARSYELFRRLSPHLPEYHYAPTCIGFCLLVRHAILAGFGLFDESYGAGYSEENDLVMRANRHGYRAVLANRAFVYHRGNASFGPDARRELEDRNSRMLAARYPEYPRAVRAYLAGPVHRAERMLAGLLPDASGRFDVLFDLSDTSGEDGALETAKALLREFAVRHADDFNLFVMAPAGHAVARGLDTFTTVEVVPVDTDRRFAVGLRFGQPRTREGFLRLNRLAVRTAWFMLDTIAWDCLRLNRSDMDWSWRHVFQHGDCIIYDSEFTRRQFASRFPSATTTRHMVSPPSFDPAEYLSPDCLSGRAGESILVVGEASTRSHVSSTVDAIVRASPLARVHCIGLDGHPHPRVTCHPHGHIAADGGESPYRRATVVVLPSHDEGFGVALLRGLACRKRVLARDCPRARDWKASLHDNPNFVLYRDDDALVSLLADGGQSWKDAGAAPKRAWADSAEEIARMLKELLGRADAFGPLLRRLADTAPATSVPPGDGTGCRDSSGSAEATALSLALRRLAALVGIAAVFGPLRFVWHIWCRGGSRLLRERN